MAIQGAFQTVTDQQGDKRLSKITCIFRGEVIFRSPRPATVFPSGLKTRWAQDYVNIFMGHDTERNIVEYYSIIDATIPDRIR